MILDALQKSVSGTIKTNVPLADYTTFKIGGPAKYFYIMSEAKELIALNKVCAKLKINFTVLGGGSNVLISDDGFDGLVIKISDNKIRIKKNQMECGAGALLSKAVGEALAGGLSGLEWGVGIPGTIGGAVCGNAGAYGGDMATNVSEVKILRHGKEKIIKNKDCRFAYRDSIFKQDGNQDIILSAVLNLVAADKKVIKDKMEKIIAQRKGKFDALPNAGSVFKNLKLTDDELADFVKAHPTLPDKFKEFKTVPIGWLLEEAGLKGKQVGGAKISEVHAGMIVNTGKATASDVAMLISIVKQKIRMEFDLQLMEEIKYIGF